MISLKFNFNKLDLHAQQVSRFENTLLNLSFSYVHFFVITDQKKFYFTNRYSDQLSGTFGELRKNHFHAGLDIRTRGREGLPVRSIKSGWINRLKVSLSGYGKVLYIEHNDGLVSVYAHLKNLILESNPT